MGGKLDGKEGRRSKGRGKGKFGRVRGLGELAPRAIGQVLED